MPADPAPPLLFPAIDLREGKVVRLTQGDYDRQTTYQQNPVDQARAFAEAGCTWLHVVDLDGARSGNLTHGPVIADICRHTRLNVEVGGGVRDETRINELLSLGVTRVVVGTAALRNWDWFKKLVPRFPHQIVLGLDAKNGYMATDGWEKTTQTSVLDLARRVHGWPLGAIVYTDIAVDGTLTGPNVEWTRRMCETTDVPIVASGGVGSLDHLRALRQLPIQGAIVGKALYEGKFTVYDALMVLEKEG